MLKVFSTCCRIKADIVARDEKETDLRRILNFGHTLGHALESIENFTRYKHGEAVVLGMRWASWVSRVRGILEENTFQRIETFLKRFPTPRLPKNLDPERLFNSVYHDKKQTHRGLSLILLEDIGGARVEPISDISREIKEWLKYAL